MSKKVLEELRLAGIIIQGVGGASGQRSGGTGSIALQLPFFKAQGLPRVDELFVGTINIDIRPHEIVGINPNYWMKAVWNPDQPRFEETFGIMDVTIDYSGASYPAYYYRPNPSIHPKFVMEILAQRIEGVHYGALVTVIIPAGRVALK